MSELDGEGVAAAAGAQVLGRGREGGFERATIDSRDAGPGDLFFGLPGERADGGQFALDALRAGAWGVLCGTQWGRELVGMRERGAHEFDGWVFGSDRPLGSLQALAREHRRSLGCAVIGITGSTGKTSVKDVCRAILPVPTHASPENYNTEIGLPLAVLAAPQGTEAMVLEMGMRGPGQIAELCEIAEPDVGVITNVGPVHVELLGSVEAIAAAKAEIVTGLREGGTAVVPSVAGPLEPHIEAAPGLLRFGEGGDVYATDVQADRDAIDAVVHAPPGEQRFEFPFGERHNLDNALASIAAGVALGMPLAAMAERAAGIVFSRLRGELVELPGDAILINDSYNANPVSMRAALDHLASMQVPGRRLAVLGEMRELGPDAADYHREIGAHARERGVEVLVGVGELAAAYEPRHGADDAVAAAELLREELGSGDVVLVKGSRAIGLEAVAERLGIAPSDPEPAPDAKRRSRRG